MKATTLLLICASFCLTNCNQSANETSTASNDSVFSITTDLQELSPAAQTFTVAAGKSAHLKTSDGSHVLVPAGAFVDATGKPVDVQVSFTAYHDAASIITSGIPMQARFEGKTGSFVSDGMFNIEAKSGSTDAKLAEGKSIQVFQPSYDQKNNYQLWYFDKKSGNWVKTQNRDSVADPGDIRNEAMAMGISDEDQNSKTNPKAPVAYNPGEMVLDLEFDENVYPELAGFSKIMWQYAGNNPQQDPANNKWLFEKDWTKTDLIKVNDFLYQLNINIGDKKFQTLVSPALAGKDLAAAKARFNSLLQNAENNKTEVASGKQNAEIQNVLYNQFNVAQMGVYNCDRFYGDPVAADLQIKSSLNSVKINAERNIFVIMDGKKNVVQYNSQGTIHINPANVNGVICVAGKGQIVKASSKSIQKLMLAKKGDVVELEFGEMNIANNDLKTALEKL